MMFLILMSCFSKTPTPPLHVVEPFYEEVQEPTYEIVFPCDYKLYRWGYQIDGTFWYQLEPMDEWDAPHTMTFENTTVVESRCEFVSHYIS